MSYMEYKTTITSKGTITIAAPVRKAMGLKPGQKLYLRINEDNKIVVDPGTNLESFKELRKQIVKDIPENKKGLSGKALKDKAAQAWAMGNHD
jgi:AbrB family looped-hinge helix DNA binding protein